MLSDSLVDAVGRQITAAREDLAVLHAQQARIDPQEYLALARLAARSLVPARRAVLDVPGDRGRDLRRARRGCSSWRPLAPAAIAVVSGPRTLRAALDRRSCSSRPRSRPRLSAAGGGAAAAGPGFLQPHPRWRFVVRQPCDRRTRSSSRPATAAQDACRLYGATYEWTGSKRSDVGEMVQGDAEGDRRRRGRHRRVGDRAERLQQADGRALCAAASPSSRTTPTAGVGNKRLAYIGQDNYQSGLKFGARIVELVDDGDVFLFIATPGQLNIQPRIDGALDAIKDSGKRDPRDVVATGSDVVEERARDRGDLPPAQEPPRHVRRRRRLDRRAWPT